MFPQEFENRMREMLGEVYPDFHGGGNMPGVKDKSFQNFKGRFLRELSLLSHTSSLGGKGVLF